MQICRIGNLLCMISVPFEGHCTSNSTLIRVHDLRCMVECTPIKILQQFCWPMIIFIVGLPYDQSPTPHPSGIARNLPIKPLVARQWPINMGAHCTNNVYGIVMLYLQHVHDLFVHLPSKNPLRHCRLMFRCMYVYTHA